VAFVVAQRLNSGNKAAPAAWGTGSL